MLPGQQTEQARQQAAYEQLSTKLAQIELEYSQSGFIFYFLTVVDDRALSEESTPLFRQAFWADNANNTFIPRIHRARTLREQCRTLLRENNQSEADWCLEELDDQLDDLVEAIVALDVHIQVLSGHIAPPCTKERLLNGAEEAEIEALRRDERFREWVLKLPEVVGALELGILENAEMAVEAASVVEDQAE